MIVPYTNLTYRAVLGSVCQPYIEVIENPATSFGGRGGSSGSDAKRLRGTAQNRIGNDTCTTQSRVDKATCTHLVQAECCQGGAVGDVELSLDQVHPRDLLCDRVLNLCPGQGSTAIRYAQ